MTFVQMNWSKYRQILLVQKTISFRQGVTNCMCVILHQFSSYSPSSPSASSQRILRPFCHSPCLETPSLLMYVPIPCYFPAFHSPMYCLPSAHMKVPWPSLLSLTKLPSYFLPSFQVSTPWPSILFLLQLPAYDLPSGQ